MKKLRERGPKDPSKFFFILKNLFFALNHMETDGGF